uniref:Uncharacterized protein n=1 Tax=Anguilla anguilla TaxID=7936 RepID=A0A0E9TG74_ANGAN
MEVLGMVLQVGRMMTKSHFHLPLFCNTCSIHIAKAF